MSPAAATALRLYHSRAAMPVAVLGFGLICLALAVGGFTESDDHYYLQAADGWLQKPPYLGTTHWHLRHPLVLAIAACFRLFGRSEMAMMLPTILCYFGIVFLTFQILEKVADRAAAILGVLLVASLPLFAVYAKIPYPDEMEMFLTLLSFRFFLLATDRNGGACLVLSGAAAGIAWVLRMSSVHLLALYGILFLIGYRIDRARYLLIAAGFLPWIAGEWLYYWIMAGNPFWRIVIDAKALDIPSAHTIGHSLHGMRPPFNIKMMQAYVPDSPIDVNWLVNPYIDFFANGSYGLICLTGVVSAFLLARHRMENPATRRFVLLIGAWAFLCLVFTIYVLNLRPQPRYFTVIAWTMAVLTALCLRNIVWPRARWAAGAILLAILGSNMLLMNLRPDPLHLAREAISYAKTSPLPVWTDRDVLNPPPFLLQSAGLEGRIRAAPPGEVPPGEVLFTTRQEAAPLLARGWTEVWHKEPSFAAMATPLRLAGDRLPLRVSSLLRRNYPETVVLRAP